MALIIGEILHIAYIYEFLPLCVERNRSITSCRGHGVVSTVSVAGAGAVRCCVPARERVPGAGEAVSIQGSGVSCRDLLGGGAAASGAIAVKADGERAGIGADTPYRESEVFANDAAAGTQATTVVV